MKAYFQKSRIVKLFASLPFFKKIEDIAFKEGNTFLGRFLSLVRGFHLLVLAVSVPLILFPALRLQLCSQASEDMLDFRLGSRNLRHKK